MAAIHASSISRRLVADARRVPQVFECQPTRPGLPDNVLPDELMIDWGSIPKGATASIFLPAVSADAMVATAGKLYGGQRLSRIDSHTVSVDAAGVSYIPIPAGSTGNLAGLLTLQLPPDVDGKSRYDVTIRQVTSVFSEDRSRINSIAVALPRIVRRKVLGAFQFSIPIERPGALLVREERSFAFFRWVLSTLSATNRWRPVMERYLCESAGRIDGWGGNSGAIPASPTGSLPTGPKPPAKGTPPPPTSTHHDEWTGKIRVLVYDRFGDFEGFRLETEAGKHVTFWSREAEIAELAKWAWEARCRMTVLAPKSEPFVPERLLLHAPS
jgi:hypothetical protein